MLLSKDQDKNAPCSTGELWPALCILFGVFVIVVPPEFIMVVGVLFIMLELLLLPSNVRTNNCVIVEEKTARSSLFQSLFLLSSIFSFIVLTSKGTPTRTETTTTMTSSIYESTAAPTNTA